MADAVPGSYYVPHEAKWPIWGSVGLTLLLGGFAVLLNGGSSGQFAMIFGLVVVAYMMFRWFGEVIRESEGGTYNGSVDASFRLGMVWFIVSEVMFFAAFFGALFYARTLSIPWIGGEGAGGAAMTNQFIWQGWEALWPTNGPLDIGGEFQVMGAWGLPAINTVILLTSGITVTWAHWALKMNKRAQLIWGLTLTWLLGFLFVGLQAEEYIHAYTELNLTLNTGVYGSTFFMLTGFHGFHVTMGAVMLFIITLRCIRGHFTPQNHFAFEAVAWYWHFVDVVWLGLFIFVYWI